jgi:hypothetical protein
MGQAAAGLFLDPGLGKTSICLAALRILKKLKYAEKVLIICPLRPAYVTWPGEIWKWVEFNDFTYSILHGPEKDDRLQEDVDLYIINPEGLKWLLTPGKTLPPFDTLIIDESTKFKESQSKRFKLLRVILPRFKRRWILTGTPMPNSMMDLFSQIYILDGGSSLGRYITHFRNSFFVKSGWNAWDWKPAPGAFERMVDKIAPLVMQLKAEDYLEMPELNFKNVEVILPDAAMKAYLEVEDVFITRLEEHDVVAANAAAAGVKCRQIANGAVYIGEGFTHIHDVKLDALEDLLEELNGHPVLLLYEFDHDRQRIMSRFPSCTDIKGGDIAEMVDRFNRGDIGVLLGHPASMGHGLNLQGACHHVIWFGITWNFEHYDQAIRRVYRQGQTANMVLVYHIVAKDTLDERVLEVLARKDRSQQDLFSAISSCRHHSLG